MGLKVMKYLLKINKIKILKNYGLNKKKVLEYE